jgi:1,2-diacylglycerol-3-alpha-glucose alpha-1,2-glucosyltransferase
MKVLLYTEGYKTIKKSGLGKAIEHQRRALEDNNIDFTTNLDDDFDILHINFYGLKSYWFAKKMRKKGKKIVYHAHSTEEDFRNSFHFSNLVAPLFKKWISTCYRLGDQIITPTEYSKRLLEGYNLNRPIKAISNGVDTKFFEYDPKKGQKFRKEYGYKKNDKVIVGIGLYIERKGILDFVELAKRMPEYKFIWFGYSPLWASPRKIKKAVNTKLDNLTFAGYVEQDMIKCALSGADLYLFPTQEETEGIPVIEALTSKIPTLIRDIPVFEEYTDGKDLYKAKDLDDFESKIRNILEGRLPDLRENGYKVAKNKDVKIVGKELIKTYKETLNMERIEDEEKVDLRALGSIIMAIIVVLALFIGRVKDPFATNIKNNKEYSRDMYYMDTVINVKVYTTDENRANKTLDEVEKLYKDYHLLTNKYDKNSELYKINHNDSKDETIEIDPRLYKLIKYGLDWYDKSDGRLNINIGGVTDIWKKYRDAGSGVPTDKELEEVDIDIKNIKLLDNNKIKNTHPNIDLGAISKGYTTEEAAKLIELMGIKAYIINAGGNVRVGDYYNKTGSYLIGIASPYKDNNNLLSSVRLTNKAVVTSGSYQRYYEYKGKTYGHIIDPKTRKPANNMVGVTVISSDSAKADALSTILFIMDIEEGQKLVNSDKDLDAIWAFYEDDGGERDVISDNFYEYK